MEKYSCWDFPYCTKYYLTHPWKWFKDLWRNIKDICMRARYGFTWSDVWNWETWFLHTTPNMLRHMADYGSAYPGSAPFETAEKWHDWLYMIADLLETGREDWQDAHNEYYEDYLKELHNKWRPMKADEDGFYRWIAEPESELKTKYFERAQELAKQGEMNIQRALSEIAIHFYSLWD